MSAALFTDLSMNLISIIWKCSSIGLHLIGTVVYTISLIYQETVTDRTDPRSTYIGDFKYLTYWNLVFQFMFNCLNLCADLLPKKRYVVKFRGMADGMFFFVGYPFTIFVCLSFWTLHYMDERNVRNPNVHNRYPEWYNHVTHTLVGVMSSLELMITYHSVPGHSNAICVIIVLYVSYTTFLILFGKYSNVWIYPFIGRLDWSQKMMFSVVAGIKLLFNYMVCVYLNKLFWPQNRIISFRQLFN